MKRTPTSKTVIVLGVIVALVALSRLAGPDESSGGGTTDDTPSSYIVTYVVDGDSNQADITYQNQFGDTSQDIGASVPWSFGGFAAAPGDFVYISAQRGGAPGSITCSIEIDGATVESNTSTGAFSICTASGSV